MTSKFIRIFFLSEVSKIIFISKFPFRVHDIDNNAKLDGLEILYAIQHTFHENRLANAERESSSENTRTMDYEDDLPWIVGAYIHNYVFELEQTS